MKLLQVPTASLEIRIKEEMEENPALELDEDVHDDGADELKDEIFSKRAEALSVEQFARLTFRMNQWYGYY